MVVGVCVLDLLLQDGQLSLKGKRQVLRGVVERLKRRFNVSVAEVGDRDLWQRTQLGLCLVGEDRRAVNSTLDRILRFLDGMRATEVVSSQIEILNW